MKYKRPGRIIEKIKKYAVLFFTLSIVILFAAKPVLAMEQGSADPLQGQLTESVADHTNKQDSQEDFNWNHLLVVYDRNADEEELANVAVLLKILTQMGYWTDCLDIRSCNDLDYESYIGAIIYTGSDHGFEDPITDYKGRLLIMGVIPDSLLSSSGNKIEYIDNNRRSETAAAALYPFAGAENVVQAVSLNGANTFQEPTYTEGIVNCNGKVWPLVSAVDDTRAIALQSYDSVFAQSVLTKEISLWLWPYEDMPHAYGNYFVIDEIYPFSDPQKLLEVVEYLNDKKMNYVLSVMPLYKHADYPAMQQLCEVLRYAQMHGSIIVHSPIIQNSVSEADLEEQLTLGFEAYLDNGVYPLAVSVPSDWIISKDYKEIIGRFRTVFFEDTDAFNTTDIQSLCSSLNSFISMGVLSAYPALSVDGEGTPFLDTYAGIEYCSFDDDPEVIKKRIDLAAASPVSNESLWNGEQSVYLNHGDHVEWNRKQLIVNGQIETVDYEPLEIPEDYDYKRNIYYRTTADLANENRVLVVFTVGILSLFVILLLRARKQMHRHFLFRKEKPKDTKAGRKGR